MEEEETQKLAGFLLKQQKFQEKERGKKDYKKKSEGKEVSQIVTDNQLHLYSFPTIFQKLFTMNKFDPVRYYLWKTQIGVSLLHRSTTLEILHI